MQPDQAKPVADGDEEKLSVVGQLWVTGGWFFMDSPGFEIPLDVLAYIFGRLVDVI